MRKKPTIVIFTEGGIIQGVTATAEVDVVVLDADVEGREAADVTQVNGEDVYASHYAAEVDIVFVQDVLKQIK